MGVMGVVPRCWRLVAAALTLVGLLTWLPAGSAGAATSEQTMAPNSTQLLATPETTLAIPADGRLEGYQFSAQVLGVATGTQLGSGTSQISAGPGQRLWVFGMTITGLTDDNANPLPITSSLVIDGVPVNFPAETDITNAQQGGYGADTTWSSGDQYWVASVPANAKDVAVQLSTDGFAQTFSFTKMAREGTQPAVLYRGSGGGEITEQLSDEHDFPVTDTSGNGSGQILPVSLSGVTLSWFAPGNASDVPSRPSMAWLVPEFATTASSSDNVLGVFCLANSLPASDFALRIPGYRTPLTPTVFSGQGADEQDLDGSAQAFTSAYGFEVPATITSATVTVTPGRFLATTGCGGQPNPFISQGSASFALRLSALPWTPPAGASAHPATIPTLSSSGTTATVGSSQDPVVGQGSRHRGGPVGVVWGVIVGIIVLGAIAYFVRRWLPKMPAWPSPGAAAAGGPTGPAPASTVTAPPSAAGPRPAAAAPTMAPPSESPPMAAPVAVVPTAAATAPLTSVPEGPSPLEPGETAVLVLGPPGVAGWPGSASPPQATVLEILIILALHPGRRYTAEQLRTETGYGRAQHLDGATIRRYIRILRVALGDRLPETRAGAGYEVKGVSSDLSRFEALVREADEATDSAAKAEKLAAALSLVRGDPFSDRPAGGYGWADVERLPSRATGEIVAAARALADLAIEHGQASDCDVATWALHKAIDVAPTDESHYSRLLDAAVLAQPSRLAQAWEETVERLRAEGESPSDDLKRHYRRLRGDSD